MGYLSSLQKKIEINSTKLLPVEQVFLFMLYSGQCRWVDLLPFFPVLLFIRLMVGTWILLLLIFIHYCIPML